MTIDIVFPKNNENKFIEIAEQLNYSELCFVYTIEEFEKKKNNSFNTKIRIHTGVIVSANQIDYAKKISDFVILKGNDNPSMMRKAVENIKPDLIFSLENSEKDDFIYQRNSGLNQVMCNFSKKNEVMIGFSIYSILNTTKKNKIIGRIMQNIKLCRKFKNRIMLGSFANEPYEMSSPHDLQALGIILGMHPTESKNALSSVSEKIKENIHKKSPKYIAKGIKFA